MAMCCVRHTSIMEPFDESVTQIMNRKWVMFFYFHSISFNIIRSIYFIECMKDPTRLMPHCLISLVKHIVNKIKYNNGESYYKGAFQSYKTWVHHLFK